MSDTRIPAKSTSSTNMCSRCSSIPFDAIFARPVTSRKGCLEIDLGPYLGSIRSELGTSCCQVCRLFASIWPLPTKGSKADERCHLRAFSSLQSFDPGLSRKPSDFPTITDSIFLGIVRDTEVAFPDNSVRSTGFVAPAPLTDVSESNSFCGRALNHEKVDFAVLRRWMDYCDLNHTEICSTKVFESVELLRVIDCERRIILEVEEPESCHYLALSYVWGDSGTSSGHLAKWSEKLPETLPLVIEDAIILTLKLNHKFLWVDRYCIRQSHETERQKLIHNMDVVYKNASACIIAAAGNDSSSGLPGVDSVPRSPQARAVVGNRLLVSTLPSMYAAVKASTWNTRAWTYQEGLFPRQRLIFTEKQVYFACRALSCSEAVHKPLDGLHSRAKQDLVDADRVYQLFPRIEARTVWDMIANYSARKLPKTDDALNAMLGIFSALEKTNQIVYQIWGVPIVKTFDNLLPFAKTRAANPVHWQDAFVTGLVWEAVASKRRASFPSWSWAGWSGAVRPRGSWQDGFRLADAAQIWLEEIRLGGETQLIAIEQLERYVRQTPYKPKFAPTIYLRSVVMEVTFAEPTKVMFQRCDSGERESLEFFHQTKATIGDLDFEHKMLQETFTGVVLGQTETYLLILVVDWKDKKHRIAERIGHFRLHLHAPCNHQGACDYRTPSPEIITLI